jgi:hypothetical protein
VSIKVDRNVGDGAALHGDNLQSLVGLTDTSLFEVGKDSLFFPINQLQLLINEVLAQPNVKTISTQLIIPNCPEINLTIQKVDQRLHGDWEVDQSRLNISAKVSGQMSDQDMYELLHEVGHAYARHVFNYLPKGVFAEIALLKEERWCWQFAQAVGTEAGLIKCQKNFWEVSSELGMTYVSAMVNSIKSARISPEQLKYFISAPEYDSTPPYLDDSHIKDVASLKFGQIKIW